MFSVWKMAIRDKTNNYKINFKFVERKGLKDIFIVVCWNYEFIDS